MVWQKLLNCSANHAAETATCRRSQDLDVIVLKRALLGRPRTRYRTEAVIDSLRFDVEALIARGVAEPRVE